ncbi:MAG: polysaccharide deacetylase family protein [Alphaproteobacteria bacterium]|jgi:peptidoglycan/xylan/chitin deacetylase (PgdA/CDA1 family)|nr:polysaccharide deacetylase family protein [Alphaproteobacteria bacterium]
MTNASPTYTVLLYHGVRGDDLALEGRNSSGKHISAARFECQMAYLAKHHDVVRISDIAAAYRGEATLPDGAVAVTFDDGFLNNRTEAWPILESLGIPATFYLTTGFIGTGRMIWSDVLEANLLGARVTSLSLDWPGDGTRTWSVSDSAERIAAFTEIKALCKAAPNEVKDDVIARVAAICDADVAPDHPLYAFMSWDDIREMNTSPLVDFGAHTVDHVSLAKVSADEMARQIDISVAAVREHLGACSLFSYPEGQKDDYNAEVVAHLRAASFDHAPSAIDGDNRLDAVGPFDIRRKMVGFEGRPFPFANI